VTLIHIKISKYKQIECLALRYQILFLLTIITSIPTLAQKSIPPQLSTTNTTDHSTAQGWQNEVAIGFDFLSNVFVNPRAGSGENRLSFGSTIAARNVLNDGRFSWKNSLEIALGIQKTGKGYLEDYPTIKIPFKKNVDKLFFKTEVDYRVNYFSKFYYSTNVLFTSQFVQTFKNNYLKDIEQEGHPIAQFLAPSTFQWSLGMAYRHDAFLSAFFTPVSLKTIIVTNPDIAQMPVCNKQQVLIGSVHGNPLFIENEDTIFKRARHQIGANLQVDYNNSFFKDRFSINSRFQLYYNYLISANKKIDMTWQNEVSLKLFKMLYFTLNTNLSYDDDIFLQRDTATQNNCEKARNNAPLESTYFKGVSYTQQMLIKFNYTF